MPKKDENVAPSEDEDNRDTENEDYRKRVVNVATPSKKPPSAFKPLTKQNILDSEDLNSFEFEKSNHSDDAHLKKRRLDFILILYTVVLTYFVYFSTLKQISTIKSEEQQIAR